MIVFRSEISFRGCPWGTSILAGKLREIKLIKETLNKKRKEKCVVMLMLNRVKLS